LIFNHLEIIIVVLYHLPFIAKDSNQTKFWNQMHSNASKHCLESSNCKIASLHLPHTSDHVLLDFFEVAPTLAPLLHSVTDSCLHASIPCCSFSSSMLYSLRLCLITRCTHWRATPSHLR
jgi:hypothetical protein